MKNHILLDPEGGEGGESPNWRESLADETLRSHPNLEKFNDVDSLAKSYNELSTKLGQRPQLPTPASSPDAYSPQVEVGEGISLNEDALNDFKGFLHENKVSADLGSGIIGKYIDYENKRFEAAKAAQEQALQEGMAALREKWGDDTDANTAQVQNFVKGNFSEEALQAFANSGLANDPNVVASLYEISKAFSEDASDASGGTGEFRHGDAASRIAALKSDPEKMAAWVNPSHKDHAAVKKEMDSLYDQLNKK